MSAFNETRVNVEAHFGTSMAAQSPATFIKYENTIAPNPSDEVWCALSMRPATAQSRGLGYEGPRTSGMVFVQVFAPMGEGAGRADAMADLITGFFEGVRLGTTSFRATQPVYLGEVEGWYQINLNIEFVTD